MSERACERERECVVCECAWVDMCMKLRAVDVLMCFQQATLPPVLPPSFQGVCKCSCVCMCMCVCVCVCVCVTVWAHDCVCDCV